MENIIVILYLDYVFNEIVPFNVSFTAHHPLPSSHPLICSLTRSFSSNNIELEMGRNHWGADKKR